MTVVLHTAGISTVKVIVSVISELRLWILGLVKKCEKWTDQKWHERKKNGRVTLSRFTPNNSRQWLSLSESSSWQSTYDLLSKQLDGKQRSCSLYFRVLFNKPHVQPDWAGVEFCLRLALDYHLVVVGELACLDDPESYTFGGLSPGRSKGRGQTKW